MKSKTFHPEYLDIYFLEWVAGSFPAVQWDGLPCLITALLNVNHVDAECLDGWTHSGKCCSFTFFNKFLSPINPISYKITTLKIIPNLQKQISFNTQWDNLLCSSSTLDGELKFKGEGSRS